MKWITYCPSVNAPKSGGGKYRRPIDVLICLVEENTSRIKCRNGKNVINYEIITRNVDSRYNGEKSACGSAMIKAKTECEKRNKSLQMSLVA